MVGTETQIEIPNNGIRNDPVVKKKIVYNMYRDMLKNYNGRANEILETKPSAVYVIEDRGIADRVESMARQQLPSNTMSNTNGVPPPPPPPLALGAVPAVRLKAEISERRPEPPACVQNAMMTKDKKPFTYTPGGLDLSQIRSPRMAKRITRNANAEGVGPLPQSPNAGVERGPLPPSALAAMQSNMPVQVFPGSVPPPPPPPGPGGPAPPPPPPPSAKAPSPPSNNQNNLPPYQRPDIKIPENPMGLLRKTGGPAHRPAGPIIAPGEELTQQPVMQGQGNQPKVQPPQPTMVQPPQPTMVQSPQPTMVQSPMQNSQPPVFKSVQPSQPIYKPVQPSTPQPVYQPNSPEHKMESRAQIGTLYIPPLNQEEIQQKTNQKPDSPVTPSSPQDTLKKAPTPSWLAGRGQQQRQQEPPAWARSPPESAASTAPTTPATPATPSTPGTPATPARVIPIRVEKTGDAFNQQQQNYQQQMQQQMLQQQQMYQQQMQQQMQQQQMQQQQMQQQQMQQQQMQQHQYRQQQQQQYQQQTQQTRQEHVVRVIPIQIEGRSNSGPMSPNSNVGTPEVDGAPVQSPTFRILQRVTSRDEEIHSQPAIHYQPTVGQPFPVEQMRKMQLSNDDRNLMNRLKNQVDENTFLHDEEDPRYRGAAIPSRAFRMLQTMTDAAEASGDPTCVPRAVIVNRSPQQGGVKRNQTKTPDGQIDQSNLPPSEQRAPEPRKYTGSAIPSRSFQMLQAMVAPENCANGTENDENISSYPYDPNYYPWGYDPMYPPPPPPYWDPYWGYYDPNAYPSEATEAQQNQEGNNEAMQLQNGTPAEQTTTPTINVEEEYYGQMPYWDPYYAYYAGYYGYYPPPPPHPYSPHAFYPSNETDDYSSTDEMNYYGARFPRDSTPRGHKSVPLKGDQITPTDTEVEEINDTDNESVKETKQSALQAIRSVSDIQVYNDTTGDEQSVTTTEDEDDETDSSGSEEEEEEEDEDSASTEDGEVQEGHLPHQLSVIFEESDISESHRSKREASIATTISEDDSSTTIEGGHEESEDSCEEDLGESTLTFRLPLKLKFGMSENGMEEVTEMIVGDSEMKPSTPENSTITMSNLSFDDSTITEKYSRSPLHRQHSNETIDNYETAEESDANESRNNSPVKSFEAKEDDDTDFWNEIKKTVRSDDENDDDRNNLYKEQEIDESGDADVSDEEIITQVEVTIPKQSSEEKEKNTDDQIVNGHIEESDENKSDGNEEDDEEDDSSDSDDDDNSDNEDAECKLVKYLRDAFASDAVKERVRALREAGKLCIGADNKEEAVSVRQRIMAIENGGATTNASRSSSMKGCDLSEEDGDSGVTSDVSRHTDTESESVPERLKRRYERAATHSRLFKLLQDACAKSDDEDDEEDDSNDKNVDRRKQLSLPLNSSEPESFASSGICSPASPTWLARELVNELLGCKSGRRYKSLPLEKLYAAAHRILQEDVRSNTSEDGSPSDTYASEYKNYYSSWEEAGSICSSTMKKRIARCPRVKSEKNVHAKMSVGAAEDIQSPTNRSQSRCRSRSNSPCRSRQLTTSAS